MPVERTIFRQLPSRRRHSGDVSYEKEIWDNRCIRLVHRTSSNAINSLRETRNWSIPPNSMQIWTNCRYTRNNPRVVSSEKQSLPTELAVGIHETFLSIPRAIDHFWYLQPKALSNSCQVHVVLQSTLCYIWDPLAYDLLRKLASVNQLDYEYFLEESLLCILSRIAIVMHTFSKCHSEEFVVGWGQGQVDEARRICKQVKSTVSNWTWLIALGNVTPPLFPSVVLGEKLCRWPR